MRRQRPAPPDGCATSRKLCSCAGRIGGSAPGFTLVELMVVTGILAILASVATPAYINYKNRAIQSEAIEALLRARMDQEIFWAENGLYTDNIRRLPSFGNTAGNSISTPNGYTIAVVTANANGFRILATKTYFPMRSPTPSLSPKTAAGPANPQYRRPQIFHLQVAVRLGPNCPLPARRSSRYWSGPGWLASAARSPRCWFARRPPSLPLFRCGYWV